jgi:hypothetical protein
MDFFIVISFLMLIIISKSGSFLLPYKKFHLPNKMPIMDIGDK